MKVLLSLTIYFDREKNSICRIDTVFSGFWLPGFYKITYLSVVPHSHKLNKDTPK